jgi:hypothetical protein
MRQGALYLRDSITEGAVTAVMVMILVAMMILSLNSTLSCVARRPQTWLERAWLASGAALADLLIACFGHRGCTTFEVATRVTMFRIRSGCRWCALNLAAAAMPPVTLANRGPTCPVMATPG